MIDTDRFEDEVRERFENPDRMLEKDFDDGFKALWLYHAWLREEATVGPGTTVQYRRATWPHLDKDGQLDFDDISEIPSHHRSPARKFQKFSSNAKTTDEGEN